MDKVQLSLIATVVVLFSYSAYLSVKIRQRMDKPINTKEKEN